MCGIWLWMVSAAFPPYFDLLDGVISIKIVFPSRPLWKKNTAFVSQLHTEGKNDR